MEAVNCKNCGCPDASRLHKYRLEQEGQDSWVVRCLGCGLVYLNPRPSPDRIGIYYPPNYQASILNLLARGKTNLIARLGLAMLRRRRTPSSQGVRLLDVGCSNGAYLAAMREEGWDVEGVEFDRAAVEYARNSRNLKVTEGDVENALSELPGNSFDVVTLWHVLEHTFDPAAALKQIHRVLKPGGTLMLEVPNFASPLASLFKKYWFPMDVPRHLYQFTPATLKMMLAKTGFHRLRVKGVPSPEAMVWSAVAARQGSPIDFGKDTLQLNPLAMALAFPLSWCMAQFVMSDTMAAVAVRAD